MFRLTSADRNVFRICDDAGVAAMRADAVRNRDAVLRATEALLSTVGADALRIADVAAEAGVGAGTIYRAFGSKSGLLLALLDERERSLQEALIRGRPPLGPGAPPAERLLAFMLALHTLTVAERDVLVASEDTPVARYQAGAYGAWHAHAALLLDQAGAADPPLAADFLLAPLGAGLYTHLLDERRISARRIRAQIERHVKQAPRATARR
jgi:AcrR family transcriptional regulator